MSDTDSLTFFVAGTPIPKGRPRTVVSSNGRTVTFTPKRTAVYEQTVRVHALRAMRLHLWRWTRKSDRFHIDLLFDFDDEKKRDLDNCVKSVLDGFQSKGALRGLLLDDWQVAGFSVRRRLGARKAGVWITVRRVTETRFALRETAPGNTSASGAVLKRGSGETPSAEGRLAGGK